MACCWGWGRRWCEGGRPLEAEVEVLLVLGPLLDATDPGAEGVAGSLSEGRSFHQGWGGDALLRGEGRSRAIHVSCFANRRPVHVVPLVAPVDSHPQQARGSERHAGVGSKVDRFVASATSPQSANAARGQSVPSEASSRSVVTLVNAPRWPSLSSGGGRLPCQACASPGSCRLCSSACASRRRSS